MECDLDRFPAIAWLSTAFSTMAIASSYNLPTHLPPKSSSKYFPIKLEIQPPVSPRPPSACRTNPCLHYRRVSTGKLFQYCIVLILESVLHIQGGLLRRRRGAMIDRNLLFDFGQHRFRVLHPPIVKDAPARWGNPFLWPALEILLRRLEMEPHGIAAGLYLTVVPDDPHGFVIEPGIRRPIVRDKVQIPEQEPFYLGIAKMAKHCLLDDRQIIFVHDLVGLNVERPIAGTVGQRNVGLLGVDQSIFSQRLVPNRLHDSDLRVADRLNQLKRAIVTAPDIHDELVDHRQNGTDRLHNRIVVLHHVPHKCKSTDLHTQAKVKV